MTDFVLQRKLTRFYTWIFRVKAIWLFLLLFIGKVIAPLIIVSLMHLFPGGEKIVEEMNGYVRDHARFDFLTFFFTCAIAPLVETLVFQFFLIKGFSLLYKKPALSVLFSALLFGWSHDFTPVYQLITFAGGLLLAIAFIVFEKRKQYPFLMVAVLHGAYNLFVLTYTYLFHDFK